MGSVEQHCTGTVCLIPFIDTLYSLKWCHLVISSRVECVLDEYLMADQKHTLLGNFLLHTDMVEWLGMLIKSSFFILWVWRGTCVVAVKDASLQCRSSDGQILIFFCFHEKECWSILIYHSSLYAYLACTLDIRILASALLCCSVHQRIQQIQRWDEFQYFCLRFCWTLKKCIISSSDHRVALLSFEPRRKETQGSDFWWLIKKAAFFYIVIYNLKIWLGYGSSVFLLTRRFTHYFKFNMLFFGGMFW